MRQLDSARRTWGRTRRQVQRWRARTPLRGWPAPDLPVPVADLLTDEQLETVNRLLPWHCFTVDSHGRRIGRPSSTNKRTTPEVTVDYRVTLLDERVKLAGRSVVEVGCFEGVHTIALARAGAVVTAVDGRVENVVKTLVRCGLYGVAARALVTDVDGPLDAICPDPVEVVFHAGVLYHLRSPASHVLSLGRVASRAVLLDTHVADGGTPDGELEAGGFRLPYRTWLEEPSDPFAGLDDHAKWLWLEDLERLLYAAGFDRVEVIEHRDERNGPRVLLLAERSVEQQSR